MSRNTVTITDTTLSVEPHGLDKMWSYTSRLEFPLTHVRGATHDPGRRPRRLGRTDQRRHPSRPRVSPGLSPPPHSGRGSASHATTPITLPRVRGVGHRFEP